MNKLLPKSICYLFCIILLFALPVFSIAQQKTISLSGFTQDVIADSVLSITPTILTTTIVDLPIDGDVLFSSGYSNNLVPYSNGLPSNGKFTSTSGHLFRFAPYNATNDLRLVASQSGTLGFSVADRVSYDSLFILATAANGPFEVDYTIHFSDATVATGSFIINDWLCNTCVPAALGSLSRAFRSSGDINGGNQFAVWEYPISLSANKKQVVSVSFSVPAGAMGVANIFGISGLLRPTLPVTLEYFTAKINNGKAFLQWKTSQELNNKKFIIERANTIQQNAFVQIGEVTATSSALGSVYNFSDQPVIQGNYLYRLSQQDFDGNKKVLGIKSISFSNINKWSIEDAGFEWKLFSDKPFTYRLIDSYGRILQVANGAANATIIKPSAKGLYHIQVLTDGKLSTQILLN